MTPCAFKPNSKRLHSRITEMVAVFLNPQQGELVEVKTFAQDCICTLLSTDSYHQRASDAVGLKTNGPVPLPAWLSHPVGYPTSTGFGFACFFITSTVSGAAMCLPMGTKSHAKPKVRITTKVRYVTSSSHHLCP